MKKALIHIGAPKTGTTAIQVQFFLNSDFLQQQGINYPLFFCRNKKRPLYGHHSLAFHLRGLETAKDYCEDYDQLVDKLTHLDKDKHLVLSSEAFIEFNKEQIVALKNYLSDFQPEVVLYVRRQDEAMQAAYQTTVLHYNNSNTFDEYFEKFKYLFMYTPVIDLWSSVFGPKQVHIRLYDRSVFINGDIVKDFLLFVQNLTNCSFTIKDLKENSEDYNRGLPSHVVKIINYYNGVSHGKGVADIIKKFAYKIYKNGQQTYDIVMPSARKSILKYYEDDNVKLLQKHLPGYSYKEIFGTENIVETDSEWAKANCQAGIHLKKLIIDTEAYISSLQGDLKEDSHKSSTKTNASFTSKGKKQYNSLHSIAKKMSRLDWANVIAQSTEEPITLSGIELPDAPDPSFQVVFTNDSGKHSILKTAFPIYNYAMEQCEVNNIIPKRILDFGCGWGRITRLFIRETDEGNLFGIDPWDQAIQMARRHTPFACFVKSEVDPPLPFVDNSFDLVFANSVFSHLSKSSAIEWGKEISRILRPGGLFIGTTLPLYFLGIIEDLKTGKKACTNTWDNILKNIDCEPVSVLRERIDSGEFVYLSTHEEDVDKKYGLAFLSREVIENEFTGLKIVSYEKDSPPGLQQAPFVLQKI